MKQGEEANGMFFLVSGGVKLVTKTPKGKDVLVSVVVLLIYSDAYFR